MNQLEAIEHVFQTLFGRYLNESLFYDVLVEQLKKVKGAESVVKDIEAERRLLDEVLLAVQNCLTSGNKTSLADYKNLCDEIAKIMDKKANVGV